MTVFVFCATRPNASVVGPGTDSANSKFAVSSRWQKYRERKSSGRQTTWAPVRAASSIRELARDRLSAELALTAICTRPTLNFCGVVTIQKSTRKADTRPYAADGSNFPLRESQRQPRFSMQIRFWMLLQLIFSSRTIVKLVG